MPAIEWLEAYLRKWPGTLVMITHDRMLIRRLATRIIEIDRGELHSWPGDYDTYLRRNQERLAIAERGMYRLHGFFTQNSLKTLYVLEELGVEYEYVFVNLVQGANRTDEFRAMTPVGKVPVLEHENGSLFESGAICRFVASEAKSPLYPADKLERAKVDQWMTFFTCHPGRWLTELYFEKIMKPAAGLGETNFEHCAQAERFATAQLKAVERHLAEREWLANGVMSIAEPFALADREIVYSLMLADHPAIQSHDKAFAIIVFIILCQEALEILIF